MASEETPPRAGDHVAHGPTGETWVVAYVDGDKIAWCGWPPGEALLSDCKVVYRCNDYEHRRFLVELMTRSEGKKRSMATRAYQALPPLPAPPVDQPFVNIWHEGAEVPNQKRGEG